MLLETIDWRQSWLTPFRLLGKPLSVHDDWIAAASDLAAQRGLKTTAGHALHFTAQQHLPAGLGYESYIAATGEVPTRDNLHDFFNALVWLHYPHTKSALNTLHAEAIRHSSSQSMRGPQRDAATLFDENAAIVVSHDPNLLDALREHEWHRVLHKSPTEFFSHTAVLLFGHALIEKLTKPYKSITAHVWTIAMESRWFRLPLQSQLAALDQTLASTLMGGFGTAAFCHLPVLGVPGWWQGQSADFYADVEVFRPKRQRG